MLLLLDAMLLLPLMLGIIVESRLKQYEAYFSKNAYVSLKLVKLDRGWFSTEAEWVVKFKHLNANLLAHTITSLLNHGEIDVVKITLKGTITHGPLIFSKDEAAHWQYNFALAKSDIQLNYPHANRSTPQQFSPLLYITGIIYFNGSTQLDMFAKDIKYNNDDNESHSKLDLQNFHLRFTLPHDHYNGLLQLNAKPLFISRDELSLSFDAMQINMRIPNNTFSLWPLDTEINIPQLNFDWQIRILHCKDLSIKLSSENSLEKLSGKLFVKLTQLTLLDSSVGPGDFTIAIKNINVPAFLAFWNYLLEPIDEKTNAISGVSPRENDQDPIWSLFTNISSNNPEISIHINHLFTWHGPLNLTAKLQLPENKKLTPENFDTWLTQINYKISIHTTLRLAQHTLHYFLTSEFGPFMIGNANEEEQTADHPSGQDTEQLASEMAKDLITKWLLLGNINIIGNEFFTVIEYKNQQLWINGKLQK